MVIYDLLMAFNIMAFDSQYTTFAQKPVNGENDDT